MWLNYCHHVFAGNCNERGDQLFPICTDSSSGSRVARASLQLRAPGGTPTLEGSSPIAGHTHTHVHSDGTVDTAFVSHAHPCRHGENVPTPHRQWLQLGIFFLINITMKSSWIKPGYSRTCYTSLYCASQGFCFSYTQICVATLCRASLSASFSKHLLTLGHILVILAVFQIVVPLMDLGNVHWKPRKDSPF